MRPISAPAAVGTKGYLPESSGWPRREQVDGTRGMTTPRERIGSGKTGRGAIGNRQLGIHGMAMKIRRAAMVAEFTLPTAKKRHIVRMLPPNMQDRTLYTCAHEVQFVADGHRVHPTDGRQLGIGHGRRSNGPATFESEVPPSEGLVDHATRSPRRGCEMYGANADVRPGQAMLAEAPTGGCVMRRANADVCPGETTLVEAGRRPEEARATINQKSSRIAELRHPRRHPFTRL